MRRSRNRRFLTMVGGVLIVAVVGFVAAGLLFQDSWAGQVLQGAGVAVEGAPSAFAALDVALDPSIPQGKGLEGGLADTPVAFQGMWEGSCPVWGIDTDHPSGVQYDAGTYKMLVEGASLPGYSADLHRIIRIDDAYQANLYASTEPDLCAAQWIVANYSYDKPAPGLTNMEEGVAIQAAIWHYAQSFQPAWDPNRWCGKQAVYNRALEIIAAAQGQCVPVPASLDLVAAQQQLEPGQSTEVTASVYDQQGVPLAGQDVSFSSSFGVLSAPGGSTDAQGQATITVASNDRGTDRVIARISGKAGIAVVDPVDQPKPRILLVMPISYQGEAALDITWEGSTAVFLKSFEAAWASVDEGQAVMLRWETAAENDNQGFNIYRGDSDKGPWALLNSALIPSQVPSGGQGGAAYEWLDRTAKSGQTYFYLLEDVAANAAGGRATRHGPVQP
jgi:hypothetical protein